MATGPRDVGISLTDGLTVDRPGAGSVRLDARQPDSAINVVGHAHADHLPNASARAVTSALTAALANVRRPDRSLSAVEHPEVQLVPAGHVAGSRATLIDCRGVTVLYTGDVCPRDRDYLTGFEPLDADVLVIEATYGRPRYVFPPVDEVRTEFADWHAEQPERPAVLFGYTLGKAQRVIRLIARGHYVRIFTTDSVRAINGVIREHLGVSFPVAPFTEDVQLGAGDALVLPSQLAHVQWMADLVDRFDARTAGFSGWAIDEGYRFQRGIDRGFVLSDHADFEELRSIVSTVDPEIVYTTHGFTDDLADALTRDGYDVTALKAYQSTIADF